MGMPGMGVADVAAYAAAPVPEAKKEVAKPVVCGKMTVAEFRNMINPVTKYYDWMDSDAFWKDESISIKQKFTVIFGHFIGDLIDESKLEDIANTLKAKSDA